MNDAPRNARCTRIFPDGYCVMSIPEPTGRQNWILSEHVYPDIQLPEPMILTYSHGDIVYQETQP